MKKWNLVIDVALCNDCNCCFMADKDEYTGNDWPPFSKAQPWEGQRWISIERRERGQFPQIEVAYLPTLGMHGDEAPCVTEAPAGAVYKRPDGIVIIDPEKAEGHPEIVATCPYGAIFWNEAAKVAQKCTGCAHLIDEGWTQTRCTQVCPTGAMQLVLAESEEMTKRVAEEGLEAYRPELGTAPRVYYKNLHRWTKAFLAGSVVFEDDGECAEGVAIILKSHGKNVGEATTNNFGDFKIDRLESGEYSLSLVASGYRPVELAVMVEKNSTTLAPVFLQAT
jgi:Fe-S-cluster-containing dehydrogenase component